MKLELNGTALCLSVNLAKVTLLREEVRLTLAAIDAGKLDDLRHFAEHGTLPEQPPVWPGNGAVVIKAPNGWYVMNGDTMIASVFRPTEGDLHWTCYIDAPTRRTILQADGEDAQEAVNAAHAKLRKAWCL